MTMRAGFEAIAAIWRQRAGLTRGQGLPPG